MNPNTTVSEIHRFCCSGNNMHWFNLYSKATVGKPRKHRHIFHVHKAYLYVNILVREGLW